ncbi:hypothetical protein FHR20_000037 [Sphingomonas leidyi]|uniref:Uncharacterized protein n=1 Tax=Sphingomonas leidyi TaxID=68569 RepID=A0A7X5UWN8_9SPHN|nr:hypothetical protein [Sphingomonas leidyi]NIJ63106.1 hypothetical protein [Sphingomonas leidyi]
MELSDRLSEHYSRRAAEEREKADRTASEQRRRLHLELAAIYDVRARERPATTRS